MTEPNNCILRPESEKEPGQIRVCNTGSFLECVSSGVQ